MSLVFDLVDDGPVADVARNKDKMIAEEIRQDHLRVTVHKGRTGQDERALSIFVDICV